MDTSPKQLKMVLKEIHLQTDYLFLSVFLRGVPVYASARGHEPAHDACQAGCDGGWDGVHLVVMHHALACLDR